MPSGDHRPSGAASPACRWKRGKRWQDYTTRQRTALCMLAAVEVGLAVAAWRDLARRDGSQVRGRKWVWALVIAVNVVGPLAYFRWGRLPTSVEPPADEAPLADEQRRAS